MSDLTIDQRLILLRKQKGVNQDKVAEACNISRVSLARYENGTRTPVIDIASRLADYYDVSVDYILGREENPLLAAYEEFRPKPLMLDGGPTRGITEDRPETQAIINSILAKLAQLDEEGQKEADTFIDFILSKRNGGE